MGRGGAENSEERGRKEDKIYFNLFFVDSAFFSHIVCFFIYAHDRYSSTT